MVGNKYYVRRCGFKACEKIFRTLQVRQKYCSDECIRMNNIYQYHKKKILNPYSYVKGICLNAGCGVEYNKRRPQQKYCSVTCKEIVDREIRLYKPNVNLKSKLCLCCGSSFDTLTRQKRFCSDTCTRNHMIRKYKSSDTIAKC